MLATPEPAFADLPGLRTLWARATMLAPDEATRPAPIRPLLDTLRVGLGETYAFLATRPDYLAFLDWIEAAAGPPDPDRLARYRAWHADAPAPETELRRRAAVMAEPRAFGDAELAQWDRDGVVVLRAAITRDEAAAIAAHLWHVVGAMPDDPDTWYQHRAGGIMVGEFRHPAMDVPRRSPRIARAFAELYGHADLLVSTDRLSFNPPERWDYQFPGPHLHWDTNLTFPIPFETQAILYLADTPADGGALQVVPGFHHKVEAWLADCGDADPRRVDLSREAVTIPGNAGDLVIWRNDLPHGASANRSARPRLAQYVNHAPMRWPDTRSWR